MHNVFFMFLYYSYIFCGIFFLDIMTACLCNVSLAKVILITLTLSLSINILITISSSNIYI